MRKTIQKRFWVLFINLIFFVKLSYGGESTSANYILYPTGINNNGGGALLSSQLYKISASVLGENIGISSIMIGPGESGLRFVIGNLSARADILGSLLPQATWQKINTPYFYWEVITDDPYIIDGFSFSLDGVPDLTVDTQNTFYQFHEPGISSGKHMFYVLPILKETGALLESMLQFEIWVDIEPPEINNLVPAAGSVVRDNQAPISCRAADKDSGLNSTATTVTLNDQPVSFNYSQEKQELEINPQGALPEGKNTILVKAVDLVGNYVVKGWDFIVDTKAPSGVISINGGQEYAHSPYVFLNINVADLTSGVKNIYISNDGVFDAEMSRPYPYAPVINNWLLTEPDVDGKKAVYVKFEDEIGNISDVYKDDIILRLLTPDTRIISGPKNITTDNFANFAFESSKPGSLFSFKLDNQDWSEWTLSSKADLSNLQPGNHYFYVKSGYDLNGDKKITIDEEDATPAQWVWAVRLEGYLEKMKEKILFWRR